MHRGWTFAFLRAVTNALLRDLNTALVAEEMRRGTRSIYVDYVDYDEIAHHAGMFRPESLAALDGLDRTLAAIARLAQMAPRRYRLVMLSDHGQSQGATFEDRYGQTLADLGAALMAEQVQSVDAAVEGLGRADSIAGDIGSGGLTGKLATRADAAPREGPARPGRRLTGPRSRWWCWARETSASSTCGARGVSRSRTWTGRWPALVPGLARHPGVGFVAGVDDAGVPWAIGADGRHDLATGRVDGVDPLAPFGAHAPRVLRRALAMTEAPDLYVNSSIDADHPRRRTPSRGWWGPTAASEAGRTTRCCSGLPT